MEPKSSGGSVIMFEVISIFMLQMNEWPFFYTRGSTIRLDEVGQTFVVRLIMRQPIVNELSSIVRLERRTMEDSSFRRIIRLEPIFILETDNQTNNKCLPKFVQIDNASFSTKTANGFLIDILEFHMVNT